MLAGRGFAEPGSLTVRHFRLAGSEFMRRILIRMDSDGSWLAKVVRVHHEVLGNGAGGWRPFPRTRTLRTTATWPQL